MPNTRTRKQVEQEIHDTLGLVPGFLASVPDDVIDSEWTLFKHYELEETAIPNKYKELMGIAVHSETKCRYCTLFHTEVARMFGATDEEIEEAVHYAKHSVGWSTYLNGMRQDYDEFTRELEQIGEHMAASVS